MSSVVLSFGRSIPLIVKRIRDTWVYAAAGAITFGAFLAPKINLSVEDYGQWIGISIFAVKVLAHFFGVGEDEAVTNVLKATEQVKKIVETKEAKAEEEINKPEI